MDTATTPQDPPLLRRPSARGNRFVARPVEASEEGAVLQRNVLRPSTDKQDRTTGRRHEIAGDLPEWDPLPPGELFLKRPSS